jgi:hypothetical protein
MDMIVEFHREGEVEVVSGGEAEEYALKTWCAKFLDGDTTLVIKLNGKKYTISYEGGSLSVIPPLT